jgi:hypothetical protein
MATSLTSGADQMNADDDVPLTRVMSELLELTDEAPKRGYDALYKAVLNGKLRTHRRGREYNIARKDLPIAARIVGLTLAADSVAAE